MGGAGVALQVAEVAGGVLQAEAGLVALGHLPARGGIQQVVVAELVHAVVVPGGGGVAVRVAVPPQIPPKLPCPHPRCEFWGCEGLRSDPMLTPARGQGVTQPWGLLEQGSKAR